MTTLITIEWKDGKTTAVHFQGAGNAERVLQMARGDVRIKKATRVTVDHVSEAVSPVEAVEIITGIRIPEFDREPHACPRCGENDIDFLELDGEREGLARCLSCGYGFSV